MKVFQRKDAKMQWRKGNASLHLCVEVTKLHPAQPQEAALRAYADRAFVNAAATSFGDAGVTVLLTDKAAIELRNRAAHDTVLTRADGLQARTWALGILRLL